mgnify:CR=1 FL=1
MPAKDRYHDTVKRALIKDGWTINDEQFTLTVEQRNLWIDIQASKGDPRLIVLVEVKELSDVDSPIEALANAAGKISMYRRAMEYSKLNFPLFLAISVESFEGILSEKIGELVLNHEQIPLVVFDPTQEVIVQWMP